MISIYLFLYLSIFILGTLIGSFLNCLIYRLKKKKSFVYGRSICPHCKHQLFWFDLVPIFSFLFLKGKCRYCHKRISFQYPLVELITGFLFVFLFWQTGLKIYFLFLAFVFSGLLVIFIYDLKHFIIPDRVIYPLIIITFLYLVFSGSYLINYMLSAFGASLFFLIIYLISKGKWLGFGDVKLALFLGLFIGWPNVLLSLFLSFVIGAIIGIGLIIFSNKGLKSQVPFGPFLVLGSFIAFFWGNQIINWYLGLIYGL